MTDLCSAADRDVRAREATAAIDAVLDRGCPEMKIAFWRAVERLYRLDAPPGGGIPAVPRPNPAVRPPAGS